MRDVAALEIARLKRALTQAERRTAMMKLRGKVAAVDPGKRRLRLKLGLTTDGGDILSPWVPWAEASAGGLKIHSEPVIGQQMTLESPSGTVGQGSVAVHATYDRDNGAPSQASDTAVIERGGRIELGPNGVRIVGPLDVSGGDITNDGVSVGKGHTHTNVRQGGSLSGPPNS